MYFFMNLRRKRGYFPIKHKLIHSRSKVCLLRGMNWIFNWNYRYNRRFNRCSHYISKPLQICTFDKCEFKASLFHSVNRLFGRTKQLQCSALQTTVEPSVTHKDVLNISTEDVINVLPCEYTNIYSYHFHWSIFDCVMM
jgi:hypothetical protein